MKVIYISGPYRSNTEYGVKQNILRAEEEALFVWSIGGVALCPHLNTAFFGGANGLSDDVWLEGDLELVKRCDAIYLIDGWRNSQGAMRELVEATGNNIPAVFSRDEVRDFIHGS